MTNRGGNQSSEERTIERGQLAVEGKVWRVGGERLGAAGQGVLQADCEALALRSGGRGLPESQERPSGNEVPRGRTGIRFAMEVPDPKITLSIGVRISGKDIGGDISCEIPKARSIAYSQIEAREIAGVITLPRTDHKSDDIARVTSQRFR